MTSLTVATDRPLQGARKAAMFLLGLGEPLSADLLRQLDPEEIRMVSAEIAELQAVAPSHMFHVFQEFESLTADSRLFAKGGAAPARRLLEQALGAEPAQRLLSETLPASPEPPATGLAIFEKTDPQQLAQFLSAESPQTIALVLANMPPRQGGAVLSSLPPQQRPRIALSMASLNRVSPGVLGRIAETIGTRLKTIRQVSRGDAVRWLASLLNHVDPTAAQDILVGIDEEDAALGSAVRDLLFVFDDIPTINDEGMRALVGKTDRKLLTMALKGTSAEIRAHFTKCMSQRAAAMLAEDMEALGPVRIREVRAAQQQIVALVRQLQRDGLLSTGHSPADEYVV